MIDWYKGLIGFNASRLDTGRVLVIAPGGEITFTSDRWQKVIGSYESTIRVKPAVSTPGMRSAADRLNFVCSSTVFEIDGNPSKFLQGHNVFGPSVASLGPIVQGIIRALPGELRPPDADSPLYPSVHRQRVDVTTSIRMDSHAMVHEFIEHAQEETRSRHRYHQGGLTGSTTVSWGAGSTRWMITCYCKLCELDKHPPVDRVMYDLLRVYAEGLLRIELRLFTKELKPRGTLFESIIWDFFGRIEVGVMKEDVDKRALNLRPPVRLIYDHWLSGHDVSLASGYLKRAAFYKYRKEILEVTGQDISLPPVKKKGKVSREMFTAEWLKEHEVKEVPEHLQKYLYQPGPSPVWPP